MCYLFARTSFILGQNYANRIKLLDLCTHKHAEGLAAGLESPLEFSWGGNKLPFPPLHSLGATELLLFPFSAPSLEIMGKNCLLRLQAASSTPGRRTVGQVVAKNPSQPVPRHTYTHNFKGAYTQVSKPTAFMLTAQTSECLYHDTQRLLSPGTRR